MVGARVTARLASVLVCLVASLATAAEWRGAARLWAGPGFDTNAARDYALPGEGTRGDAFLFGLGQAQGRLAFAERFTLLGDYEVAGRKFVTMPSEDTVLQNARLELNVGLLPVVGVGVQGRVRDRHGAGRGYTDLQGGAVLDLSPHRQVDLRFGFGAHRFLYWPRFPYSFHGPEGSLNVTYRFNRAHRMTAYGSFMARTFNDSARAAPGDDTVGRPIREDSYFNVGVSWAYRGPFQLSAGYGYFDDTSNAWGETVRRHRLTVTGGVRLPWKLTLMSSLVGQLSSYPQGVYLSPELMVVEDDESGSSLTVKLVRPVSRHVEVDVRYAGYLNFLPQNAFIYLRHVVSVGVAVAYP